MTLSHELRSHSFSKKRDLGLSSYQKIFFSIFTLFITVSFHEAHLILLVFLGMSSLILYSGMSPFKYLKALSIPMVFLIPSIGIIVFIKGSNPIFGFEILGLQLQILEEGIYLGAILLLRAMAGVSCLYFLILTTPIEEIIEFLRKLKLPEIVIEILFLSFKLIFDLSDRAEMLKRSLNSKLGFNTIKNSFKSISLFTSSLFVGSLDRSIKINKALESRCCKSKMPSPNILEDSKGKEGESIYNFVLVILFDIALIALKIV